MIRLEDISAELAMAGMEPALVATVVSVNPITGGAVQVIYRAPERVLKERVCFTKEAVYPLDQPGLSFAAGTHPGRPLIMALSDVLLQQDANLLRQGAILVGLSGDGKMPRPLFVLTQRIKSGDGPVVAKHLQLIRGFPECSGSSAGWRPQLELEPRRTGERALLVPTRAGTWQSAGTEQHALALAATSLVPKHYNEVVVRQIVHADRNLSAVHKRLSKEIAFCSERFVMLPVDKKAGTDVRLNPGKVGRTLTNPETRSESRKRKRQSMRHIIPATPVLLSGALVVPAGLLMRLSGETPPDPTTHAAITADSMARSRNKKLDVDAVRRAEESSCCHAMDVSPQKCACDLIPYPLAVDGKQPVVRHTKVKGPTMGATTMTIKRNEPLYAPNRADKFLSAVVIVAPNGLLESLFYLVNPFPREPDWRVPLLNYRLDELLDPSTPCT